MRIKNTLVIYQTSKSAALKKVKEVLKKNNIPPTLLHRSNLNAKAFRNKDLILVVGGDGTFLRTSHFIKDNTPALGINAELSRKEGFFMRADKKDFERKFSKLMNRKHKIIKLQRLQAKLNNKLLPNLALNEVFIASHRPHHTSVYKLDGELQKSSGVIIATAAGSHAWLGSAGGKRLPIDSKRFQYIVRDPYTGKLVKPKKTKAILTKKSKVRINSLMKKGYVVIDSQSREYSFNSGKNLVVKQSNNPLYLVSF